MTMVTKQGLIKRTPLEQYANIRKSGLIGIALNEGDALAWTRLTSGHDMLIVATRNGQAIRLSLIHIYLSQPFHDPFTTHSQPRGNQNPRIPTRLFGVFHKFPTPYYGYYNKFNKIDRF